MGPRTSRHCAQVVGKASRLFLPIVFAHLKDFMARTRHGVVFVFLFSVAALPKLAIYQIGFCLSICNMHIMFNFFIHPRREELR